MLAAVLSGAVSAAPESAMENVLVTGTFSPRPVLTSSVSVLDSQQIAALNKTSVADLLKTLPGLLVEEQGGPGGLTAVSIRGGESNFTLVLVDGVEVNDPTNSRGGSFDLANLNPGMVERIEVVRGAQSSIYSSDALAGVINIITRRPREGHSQQVHGEAGEHDYSNLGASAVGIVENVSYAVELASRDDGEPVPNSHRKSDSANLRLGWRPAAVHELNLGYRYLDGHRKTYPEQSGGPRFAVVDDLDSSDYTQQVLSLGWAWQIASDWDSTVQLSRFDAQDDYWSPGISPYTEVPPNAADTDFTRDKVLWINTWQPAPAYTVDLGADYRHDDGKSDGYLEFFGNRSPTDFELDRDARGVFAGITATPLADVLLQSSVRYDDPQEFDSETSWQVGSKYSLGGDVTLAANWGEAYKLPSFFALGHALVGNPDLQPERGESWDAGLAWWVSENLELEATWFDNDYRDLVDFDDASFRNVNRQNVKTSGIELQSDWQVLDALSLQAQGTYTDIDVVNEDTRLTGRPQWTASLVTQWRITGQWRTVLDYQYAGEQWAASRHTGEEVTEELDSYHRLDWVLHWQVAKAWQLQLSVDNVLNENYETAVGFSAPEREFRLGVRLSN